MIKRFRLKTTRAAKIWFHSWMLAAAVLLVAHLIQNGGHP